MFQRERTSYDGNYFSEQRVKIVSIILKWPVEHAVGLITWCCSNLIVCRQSEVGSHIVTGETSCVDVELGELQRQKTLCSVT